MAKFGHSFKTFRSVKFFAATTLIVLSCSSFANSSIIDLGSISIDGEVRRPILPYTTSKAKLKEVSGRLIVNNYSQKLIQINLQSNQFMKNLKKKEIAMRVNLYNFAEKSRNQK